MDFRIFVPAHYRELTEYLGYRGLGPPEILQPYLAAVLPDVNSEGFLIRSKIGDWPLFYFHRQDNNRAYLYADCDLEESLVSSSFKAYFLEVPGSTSYPDLMVSVRYERSDKTSFGDDVVTVETSHISASLSANSLDFYRWATWDGTLPE